MFILNYQICLQQKTWEIGIQAFSKVSGFGTVCVRYRTEFGAAKGPKNVVGRIAGQVDMNVGSRRITMSVSFNNHI